MTDRLDLNEAKACAANGRKALAEIWRLNPPVPLSPQAALREVTVSLESAIAEVRQLRASKVVEEPARCPWCGTAPAVHATTMRVTHQGMTTLAEICCLNPKCPVQPSLEAESSSAATTQWNTRL